MAKTAANQPGKPAAAEQPTTAITVGTFQALKQIERVNTLDYAYMDMVKGGAGADVLSAFQQNLGGQTLSTFDFTRIKVPSGETRAWAVVNPETGEIDYQKTVDGVIVAFKDQRAYWEKPLSDQGATRGPPQCVSFDLVKGQGNPGIMCERCPFSKFGSSTQGTKRGQACKLVRFLFVMRPGNVLPDVIPVPPTSLQPFRGYLINLAKNALPFWKVVTRFSLIPDKNAAGTEYSKVGAAPVTILEGEAAALTNRYAQMIQNLLTTNNVKMNQTDLEADPDGAGGADPAAAEVASAQVAGASDHHAPADDSANRADLI